MLFLKLNLKNNILNKQKRYKIFSSKVRKSILKIANISGCSHIGSNLSIVDILTVVYQKILTKNDSFILSKGHACLSLYCVLKEKGLISDKTLNTFGKNNSILMSHTSHKVKGIDLSTGSLGHGLPVATGMALANKIKKTKAKIFVLLSDGELDEGSNWEAMLFCAHHKLDNIILIVDYNKLQSIDLVKKTLGLEPIVKKFQSFGFKTLNIDGHNFKQIERSLNLKSSKPLAIIANTVKGKGVKFMENSILWHYKSLDLENYKKAIKTIK